MMLLFVVQELSSCGVLTLKYVCACKASKDFFMGHEIVTAVLREARMHARNVRSIAQCGRTREAMISKREFRQRQPLLSTRLSFRDVVI